MVAANCVRGGLGSAVVEVVATRHPAHIRMIGFPGFMPTGSADCLFKEFGLTANGIAGAVREVIAARDA